MPDTAAEDAVSRPPTWLLTPYISLSQQLMVADAIWRMEGRRLRADRAIHASMRAAVSLEYLNIDPTVHDTFWSSAVDYGPAVSYHKRLMCWAIWSCIHAKRPEVSNR